MHQLLHIEADETLRQTVAAALAEGPLPFAVTARACVTDDVTTAPPDAILLGVPAGSDVAAAIEGCRTAFSTVPIVILAEVADLAFARTALRAGAHDVVTCSERALAVLSRIVVYAIDRSISETRSRASEQTAANLARLLDALLAAPVDAVVQTDAAGTIERLSPSAAALLGLDLQTAIGTGLAEHLPWSERQHLAAMLRTERVASQPGPASFGVTVGGIKRVLELEPTIIVDQPADGPRLFKVSEVAADFAIDETEPEVGATRQAAASPVLTAACQPAPAVEQPQCVQAMPKRQCQPSPVSVARDEVAAAVPVEDGGQRALAIVEVLAQTATWRFGQTSGSGEAYGFLSADAGSAQTLAQLATSIAEDVDLAIAVDALQITAWKTIAASAPNSLPKHLVLEVSYGTAANRPHFDQLQAQLAKLPPALANQLVLTLKGVPKGIYVPTLAKTIRAIGTSHGKPALHLADLEADYRSLVLGDLALVVIGIADLKRALAKDGKRVTKLLERLQGEGCSSVVRGAKGPLAEALRNRLGVTMTVDI